MAKYHSVEAMPLPGAGGNEQAEGTAATPLGPRVKIRRRRRIPMRPEEVAEMEYVSQLKAQHQDEIFRTRLQLKETLDVIRMLKQQN